MAGRNPNLALDAYVERARLALSCLTAATVFGSDTRPGVLHSLGFFVPGQNLPNRIRLRTHESSGELQFRVAQLYNLVHQPNGIPEAAYDVWTSFYQYLILDKNGRELVVFHWEPDQKNLVTRPHVHLPAAEPVILTQPAGSPRAGQKTYLNKLHLPTGKIGLEDVVEFLITDLQVDPLLPNWKEILDEVRIAGNR